MKSLGKLQYFLANSIIGHLLVDNPHSNHLDNFLDMCLSCSIDTIGRIGPDYLDIVDCFSLDCYFYCLGSSFGSSSSLDMSK